MSQSDKFITALDAMEQMDMSPIVFANLLRNHEKELPLYRNDEAMTMRYFLGLEPKEKITIRDIIELFKYIKFDIDFLYYWLLNCFFWRKMHIKFYTKELQNPDNYLCYFKIEHKKWDEFYSKYKNSDIAKNNNDNEQNKTDDIEYKIKKWEEILHKLNYKEQGYAKIAIAKLQGKKHEDAYTFAYPDIQADPGSKKSNVRLAKKKVHALAIRNDLPMPEWDSRKLKK